MSKNKHFRTVLLLILWTILYLTDRAFFSDISKMLCGVTQGSIPGLLLVFQHKHGIEIKINLKNDFSNLYKWLLHKACVRYFLSNFYFFIK